MYHFAIVSRCISSAQSVVTSWTRLMIYMWRRAVICSTTTASLSGLKGRVTNLGSPVCSSYLFIILQDFSSFFLLRIFRSKTCPQCRNKVTENGLIRIYPTVSSDQTLDDATTLQTRLDDAQLQLRQHTQARNELNDKLKDANDRLQRTMLVRATISSCWRLSFSMFYIYLSILV